MPKNVTSTISDKKFPIDRNGMLENLSGRENYPFGSPMDGRIFSSEKYRYSFNTQEKVDEVYGKGNLNTALFWEYDTRLGRQWNFDSKKLMSICDDKLIKVQDIDCDIIISEYKDKVEVDVFKRIEDLKLVVVFTNLREVYYEKK